MAHEADHLLAKIEDSHFDAVQALLALLDKHGIEALKLALEEAIEVKTQEQEQDQ